MKRKNLTFLSFLFFCIVNQACVEEKAENISRKIMGRWYKREIIIPKSLKLINQSINFNLKDLDKESEWYVLHYFEGDCDKCVNDLQFAQQFILEHKNNKLKYIFIGCASTEFFIKEAIKDIKFKFPIYFDKNCNSFKKINNIPVDDPLYNTMLINNKRQIYLFGSIFRNKKAEKLYMQLIENL
jgi:hypothetical protein